MPKIVDHEESRAEFAQAVWRAIVELAERRFGGLDLLFNNAGVFRPKPFVDLTEDEYDWFLDTILKGKFFTAQAAAKAMQRRGGGAIVHTGSLWAIQVSRDAVLSG